MPAFVLTVLKAVFLALLYFFVYRAIRSVVIDLRGPRQSPRREESRATRAPAGQPRRSRTRGRRPQSIVVLNGHGGKPASYRLEGPLQVGRSDACGLVVPDTYVSEFHARIFDRDGSWYVEDLGSTNGTFLNQRKVTSPSELHPGDRVRVGKTTLEVRA